MRVLLLHPFWPGPVEYWLHRQIEELSDHLVSLMVRHAQATHWHETPVFGMWESGSRFKLVEKARQFISKRRNLRWIAKQQFDLILINYSSTWLRNSFWLDEIDCPKLVYTHGFDLFPDAKHLVNDHYVPLHRPEYAHELSFKSQHPSVRFIANSQFSKRRLVELGVPESRIKVRYFGCVVPPVTQRTQSPITFLYLGRLVGCKGPCQTIQAFDLACRKGLTGRLIIAGDGALFDQCRIQCNQAVDPSRISLLGEVDWQQGCDLRNTSHVFTAHSQFCEKSGDEESFGVAFIEAMAAGLPLVTGRSNSITEYATHEHNALLFDPGDISAHADAMLRMEQDSALRLHLGNNARQTVIDQFDPQRQQQELLDTIRTTIEIYHSQHAVTSGLTEKD